MRKERVISRKFEHPRTNRSNIKGTNCETNYVCNTRLFSGHINLSRNHNQESSELVDSALLIVPCEVYFLKQGRFNIPGVNWKNYKTIGFETELYDDIKS